MSLWGIKKHVRSKVKCSFCRRPFSFKRRLGTPIKSEHIGELMIPLPRKGYEYVYFCSPRCLNELTEWNKGNGYVHLKLLYAPGEYHKDENLFHYCDNCIHY